MIGIGSEVVHVPAKDIMAPAPRGIGVVVDYWGGWMLCKVCGQDITAKQKTCDCGGKTKEHVKGRHIMKVEFRVGKYKETHHINKCWLRPALEREKKNGRSSS